MPFRRSILLLIPVVILGVLTGSAQFGPRAPEMRGVWNPVVGSGAAYQVESRGDRKSELEIAVVGTESVSGKTGYWLEMGMNSPGGEGRAYIKNLIVLDGKQTRVTKMVMQAPGQPPMEMPIEMMNRGGGRQTEQPADVREQAERVGTEAITVPAGSFTCEHYRMKDGSADVWVSEKVAPWGLVKMTGRDTNMTLLRVITNAKTHITGTPMKFDPMEMMRRQMEKP